MGPCRVSYTHTLPTASAGQGPAPLSAAGMVEGAVRLGVCPSPCTREGARSLALGTSLLCALPTQHSPQPVLGPGNIKTLGDAYEFAVDVSDFSPEDIIVTTSNNHIERCGLRR